jgi:hypothetical protein
MFNNGRATMATVNFSVPDDVKRSFNEAFAGQNKSAVIAALMLRAVAEKERQQQQVRAIDELLALRQTVPPATDEAIRQARQADRP